MLTEITVENLAIIDRIQVQLGPGFTALTGETGAGKSLLVDALELAFGSRADSDLVRDGATKLSVHLVLDLQDRPQLLQLLATEGVDSDNGQIIVQREVFAEGKSQGRINGKVTTAQLLRRLGECVVDLHGQHDHQSLLRPEEHLGLLDSWVPSQTLQAEFSALREQLEQRVAITNQMRHLQQSNRERAQRLDMLTFQIAELEEAQLVEGESVQLESELVRLRHADRIRGYGEQAVLELMSDEGSAYDRLADGLRLVQDAAQLDPSLQSLAGQIEALSVQLKDSAHELAAYVQALESDPARLDMVVERLELIRRLGRKYGETESAMVEYLAAAQVELDTLTHAEASLETLERDVALISEHIDTICERLTALRQAAASEFEELVRVQLHDIGMDKAILRVGVESAEVSTTGADQVELLFTANPGEPLRPLAKIASGGEASRVMLAIKAAMAGRSGVPIMVFDEVDAGLGGQAAAMVARKLAELSQHYQVLAISHLPQIASRATGHLHIFKEEVGGRVTTRIMALEGENRVHEIARMIAGEQVNASATAHAASMLGLH